MRFPVNLASIVANLVDKAIQMEFSEANQLPASLHFPDGTAMVSNAFRWD